MCCTAADPVTPPPSPEPSCIPSPCGPNSQCQISGGIPACSCLPDYIGSPPTCRPECVLSAECPSQLACIKQKCRDPCPGSCGANANCRVVNHVPICSCNDGFTGDPFTQCSPVPLSKYFLMKTSYWYFIRSSLELLLLVTSGKKLNLKLFLF